MDIKRKTGKKLIFILLIITLVVTMAFPKTAFAETLDQKTIRVGWYDSTYNTIDEHGKRTGYAYEYQLKLGAYNGWKYEYVEGSWSDLLHMLETGEIDLMSDVSYKPEREAYMYYPSLPMGTEEYYVFVAPGNTEISSADYTTLNGKKVGVNLDSIQADFYEEWEEHNRIESDVVYLATTEEESIKMMESGEIDAYVTVDSFVDPGRAIPIVKVGSSDYYFTVSKARPDLVEDLEYAMNRIQEENRYYNVEMYEKYIRHSGANGYISTDEANWLSKHGVIKVGYQDNYLAFCAYDKKTEDVKGLLKDYLDLAKDALPNADLEFKAVAYPTAKAAMEALQKGQVDCVFPANFSPYEAETMGIYMSPALITSEMYAVVRTNDANIFAKDKVVAAINEGNLNYDAFLDDNYPDWEKKYYADSEECLKAISKGDADTIIISNYRYNNIARLCERYNLTTLSLNKELDYSFAIEKGMTELYAILAKANGQIPEAALNAAVARYITEDSRLTLTDVITANLPLVMCIGLIIIFVILALLIQNMRAVRKANELIKATETDKLTGLYNRDFFFEYANKMNKKPMDALVFNIEQFHSVNALFGRELGDKVLREMGNEIAAIASENKGIAGRFGADRFDIYCEHRTEYQSIYDRLQAKLEKLVPDSNIRLRMGVMPYDENLEPVQQFDRARTACHMGRGNYKKSLIIYDERISEKEKRDQRLVADFKKSLKNREFKIYYQPKYDITHSPAKLISVEALCRWYHPDLGLLTPPDFIPLLERNGQIGLLDQYVWEEAAAQIAEWKENYRKTIPVSINISRVDLFDQELENNLELVLMRNGLDHKDMILEITESAYTKNADQVIHVVERLRKRGFRIAMDDFGTGYSSLNVLSTMPIDVIKMDIDFVKNIEVNERDKQLVALILEIANKINVPVIAEGVETQAQLSLLHDLGCPMVQGFYFSRPLPPFEFEKAFLK